MDHELWNMDNVSLIVDSCIVGHGLWIVDHRLWIIDCASWIMDSGLWNMDRGLKIKSVKIAKIQK